MSEQSEQKSSAEQMLAEVPGAKLDESEADAIFAAAWAARDGSESGEPHRREGGAVVSLDAERSQTASSSNWARYAVAAALLLAGGLVGWLVATSGGPSGDPVHSLTPDQEYTGIKSAAPPVAHVELDPMLGRIEQGRPVVVGPLGDGQELAPGDRVLFRYELRQPARLALLGQEQGGSVEVLWQSDAQLGAGNAEIQANGQALGLDPSRYDGAFRLALVSLTGPNADVDGVEMLTDDALQKVCESCGYDLVQMDAP